MTFLAKANFLFYWLTSAYLHVWANKKKNRSQHKNNLVFLNKDIKWEHRNTYLKKSILVSKYESLVKLLFQFNTSDMN